MRYRNVLPWVLGILLGASQVDGREPGWVSQVITPSAIRSVVEATPVIDRPYRPFHFYGNAIRRRHYRGTMLPAPRDLRNGLAVLVRRPYVPLQNYLGR